MLKVILVLFPVCEKQLQEKEIDISWSAEC